jgi:hypothetical protein
MCYPADELGLGENSAVRNAEDNGTDDQKRVGLQKDREL